MHDGFGTIKDGYFVPHSHELRWGDCGHLLLLPVGATHPDQALAIAEFTLVATVTNGTPG